MTCVLYPIFQLTGVEAQKMAMAIVRVMHAVMVGSPTAKVYKLLHHFS